jgi:hypothetical protein
MELTNITSFYVDGIGFDMRGTETSFARCAPCAAEDAKWGTEEMPHDVSPHCLGGTCGELVSVRETTDVVRDAEKDRAAQERDLELWERGYAGDEPGFSWNDGLVNTTDLCDDGDRWGHTADAHVVEQHNENDHTVVGGSFGEEAAHFAFLKAMRAARLERCLEWLRKCSSKELRARARKVWGKRYSAGVQAAVGREGWDWVGTTVALQWGLTVHLVAWVTVAPKWELMWLSRKQWDTLLAAV